VRRAIADGVDVRGFFHWTGVDNYEWGRGFTVPFGLFDRDRNAKGSAALARSWAEGTEAA
jgi:beta-glucosidase